MSNGYPWQLGALSINSQGGEPLMNLKEFIHHFNLKFTLTQQNYQTLVTQYHRLPSVNSAKAINNTPSLECN